jgi:hypothetical protein
MDGLSDIWPSTRTKIDGVSLGDAWNCSSMPTSPPAAAWENIVPFHKLTQWLCYSLMVPMTKLLNVHFAGAELMTGLPEYRNGGLLVDTGLLTLKDDDVRRGLDIYQRVTPSDKAVEVVPTFEPGDDVVVEWRAVTVGFLDELLAAVNKRLGLQLSLAQMLEAGTWKVRSCARLSPSPSSPISTLFCRAPMKMKADIPQKQGGREIAQVSRPITKGPPIGIISDGTVF